MMEKIAMQPAVTIFKRVDIGEAERQNGGRDHRVKALRFVCANAVMPATSMSRSSWRALMWSGSGIPLSRSCGTNKSPSWRNQA